MPVYFIRQEGGPVKIGWTKNVRKRLEKLQTASPVPLSVLGVVEADRKLEKELHHRFGVLRLCGEWFKFRATLAKYIEASAVPYNPRIHDEESRPRVTQQQMEEAVSKLYVPDCLRREPSA